jgi:glycosidase
MVAGDPRRMRLAYSLMFSLPGTPALLYGEEIGLGDDLGVRGRLAVRPPMHWSPEEHGGFAPPGERELIRPVIAMERFAPEAVNVADQRRDRASMLNWMERLIRRRRECLEIGFGRPRLVPAAEGVFAHRMDWQDVTLVAAHNLTGDSVRATLDVDGLQQGDDLLDLLGDADPAPAGGSSVDLELPAYGYSWLRVRRAGQRPLP